MADTIIIYFTKIIMVYVINISPKFEIFLYLDNSFQNVTMSKKNPIIINKYNKISNFRITFTVPTKTIAIMEKIIQIYLYN
jgi:hypothetical protein